MGFLGRSQAVEVALLFLPKLTSWKVFLQIWMKKLWKKHMFFSGQKYNMSSTSKIPKYHRDPGTPKQTWLFKKKQPVEEKYVTQIILSPHKFDQMFHLKVNGYLFLQSICQDTKRWSTINFKASASPTKSSKTFGLRLQPGHKWWKRKCKAPKSDTDGTCQLLQILFRGSQNVSSLNPDLWSGLLNYAFVQLRVCA